jgi:hypothetical protein
VPTVTLVTGEMRIFAIDEEKLGIDSIFIVTFVGFKPLFI